MPKNKGKGGKKFKRRKNINESVSRELIFRENNQLYGIVTKILGDSRMLVYCSDEKTRNGRVRGKMRKRQFVSQGNLVLVSLRDFQEGKVDIVHKYNDSEAKKLVQYEEITLKFMNISTRTNNTSGYVPGNDDDEDDNPFIFDLI